MKAQPFGLLKFPASSAPHVAPELRECIDQMTFVFNNAHGGFRVFARLISELAVQYGWKSAKGRLRSSLQKESRVVGKVRKLCELDAECGSHLEGLVDALLKTIEEAKEPA